MAEWLTEALDLQPGMRVLDLGCGRASSSIFLHREFGVQVWATDLWCDVSENAQRIRDAGVGDQVFPVRADARALFSKLARTHRAPHAALIERADAALVSVSPERFLRVDRARVATQPIKGTAADLATLRASEKDHAEHVMIVDLARNDLGRVAVAGSVVVDGLETIVAHPGLFHMVSTVHADLRSEVGVSALLRATLPPASVTGAPKPAVLAAIDRLEPTRRGMYCGTMGWIDADAQTADLAVTIRTFVISPHGTDLGVGGGIVVDSTATSEWQETELKASRLLRAVGAYEVPAKPTSAPRVSQFATANLS